MNDDGKSPREPGMTYKGAGVDVDAAARMTSRLKDLAARTARPEVVAGVGGFAGMFRVPRGLEEPVLLAAADGVGTKLILARRAGTLAGAGRDLVAMNVNDIAVYGGEPWFFLDCISAGSLLADEITEAVGGMAAACREAGCTLLGGETAQLPGLFKPDDLDMTGFAVGGVERDLLVDGSEVQPGDAVIGLASTGIHSNGFSLVRRVLERVYPGGIESIAWERPADELGGPPGEVLLAPTAIYVQAAVAARDGLGARAMAHITGGGLVDNVPRTLPSGLQVLLRPGSWPEPPVFEFIRRNGPVGEDEMRRTFNMGIGFTVIVPPDKADEACRVLGSMTGGAWIIGEITAAPGEETEVAWA